MCFITSSQPSDFLYSEEELIAKVTDAVQKAENRLWDEILGQQMESNLMRRQLRDRLDTMRKKNYNLQTKNEKLFEDFEAARKSGQALNAELSRERTALGNMKRAMNANKCLIEGLEIENTTMKDSNRELWKQNKVYKKAGERLYTENANLKSKLEALTNDFEVISRAEINVRRKFMECDVSRRKLSRQATALEEANDKVVNDCLKLTADLEIAKKDAKCAMEELAAYKRTVDTARSVTSEALLRLQEKYDALLKDKSEIASKYKSSVQKTTNLQKKLGALDASIEKMKLSARELKEVKKELTFKEVGEAETKPTASEVEEAKKEPIVIEVDGSKTVALEVASAQMIQ